MSKNTDLGNLVNGLFVSSTRNVGIGMSTPANAVVVDKGTATASYLQFTAGTTTGQLATDGFEVGIDASGNGIISQQENLPLMIYTNNTERMRITSAGNVGIGTSSPSNLLEVYNSILGLTTPIRITNAFGAIGANVEMMMSSAGNAAGVRLRCEAPGGSNQDFSIYVTASNTLRSTPSLFVQGSSGNVGIGTTAPSEQLTLSRSSYPTVKLIDTTDNAQGYFQYHTDNNYFILNAQSNHPLLFGTNDTERMRITSGGNVGIGITGAANLLSVRGTIDVVSTTNASTTSFLRLATFPDGRWGSYVSADSNYNGELSTNLKLGTNLGGTHFDRMTVSANGSIGAPSGTNIYNASDARLKRNINTIDGGLNKVLALNPVKFNWIEKYEPSEDGKDMLGFIAQEVLLAIPEAVENFASSKVIVDGKEISDVLRVNEKFIIPVLVKAIQELSAKITLLENK